MVNVTTTLQKKRDRSLSPRHESPACPRSPSLSSHYLRVTSGPIVPDHQPENMTGSLTGHHQQPGCLPSCRLRNGREDSDGETGAALGPATSNNFSTILGAHALPEPMFALALEIRRLLESERHDALPPRCQFVKRRHYRSGNEQCQ
jgi:hypothetical protein